MIKKGVRDRVQELANCDGAHPAHRPPYVHLIPLAEIIGLALQKSPSSKTVNEIWESLLAEFGTEVAVLVDAPIDSMYDLPVNFNVDHRNRVVAAIEAFRTGKIRILPGGGGKYGVIKLQTEIDVEVKVRMNDTFGTEERRKEQKKQRSLFDF